MADNFFCFPLATGKHLSIFLYLHETHQTQRHHLQILNSQPYINQMYIIMITYEALVTMTVAAICDRA